MHQLVPAEGDARPAFVPARGCKRVGAHSVAWAASCSKCGASADRTSKWIGLGRSVCRSGEPDPGLRWKRGCHELAPHLHGLKCVRCSLTCHLARREAVGRARCPVWSLVDAAGCEIEAAREWAAWNAALPVRFAVQSGASAGKGSKRVVPVEGPVQGPAKRPRVEPRYVGLVPYSGHALATGAGMRACLRCGLAWGWSVRPGEVCSGKAAALPPLVLQLLEVGAHDASLQDGSVAVRSLAVDWGWVAVLAVRGMNVRLPAHARPHVDPPD